MTSITRYLPRRTLTAVALLVVLVASPLLFQPQYAVSQASPVTIFLTSGTSWTVPSDWNSSNNTIEVIAGGGGGGTGTGGGGGGAYSKAVNVTLTPSNAVSLRVGAGGAQNATGGDTYFCNSTSNCASISGTAVVAGGKGGGGASNVVATPGSGGAAASGVGSVKYSGGNGGAGEFGGCSSGGGGGGGAGGSNGDGRNGGAISSCSLGGGGGGGGGGTSSTAGSSSSGSNGGAGGQGRSGSGGGAAGVPNGGNGSNGGGGGGGKGTASVTTGDGGNGGAGTDWDATHGAGGGGAGSGGSSDFDAVTGNAGDGALYGGGGGGVGYAGSNGTFGFGPGAPGIIVITYGPIPPATVPDAPTSLSATGDVEQISLSWTAPASDGGSPITNYKLYRGTSPAPTTLYQTLGSVLSYTDTTVTVGTTYYYRVIAVNAVGDSAYSNEDSASASSSCPSGPSGGNISGWAWSDTIGWISLNGSDAGTCTTVTYGLNLSGSTITGYAWSENVGWIQFGGLSGFPSGAGTVGSNVTVQGSTVVGWARAIAYSDAEAGGWDGWISLSGTGYGVTVTEGALTGWAWGDTNLGWIDFSANYPCAQTAGFYCTAEVRHHQSLMCGVDTIIGVPETCGYACSAGACVPPPNPTGTLGNGLAIRLTPTLVRPGRTVTVTWGTEDTTSCTVIENNSSITDSWTGTSGSETSSLINTATTYTLDCDGGGDTSLTQTATVRTTARWREI